MKTLAIFGIPLLGACLMAMPQKRNTTAEMIALEKEFNAALMHADSKAVEAMIADDMVLTNPDGAVTHKSEEVESLRSGDEKLDSVDLSDVRVLDLGPVAVVTGKLVEKGRYKTTDVSGEYRFTDVWAKRNGKWQLVAGHESLLTPAK